MMTPTTPRPTPQHETPLPSKRSFREDDMTAPDDDPPHDDRCICEDCMPWEPGYEGHGYWGADD